MKEKMRVLESNIQLKEETDKPIGNKTRHIKIDQYFIKEKLNNGPITTAYTFPARIQLAEVFIKELPTWFSDLGKTRMIEIL